MCQRVYSVLDYNRIEIRGRAKIKDVRESADSPREVKDILGYDKTLLFISIADICVTVEADPKRWRTRGIHAL